MKFIDPKRTILTLVYVDGNYDTQTYSKRDAIVNKRNIQVLVVVRLRGGVRDN